MIHDQAVELYPDEMIYSAASLAENWRWSKTEVENLLSALERSGVLSRSRRGGAAVLQLHHDGSSWQPLEFPPAQPSLPKNVLPSSSLGEEQEEKESSEDSPEENGADDGYPKAEWAEFLRQAILSRRLGSLNRARLLDLRAEFEAKLRAEGRWPATSSSASVTAPPRRSAPGRTSSRSDRSPEVPE